MGIRAFIAWQHIARQEGRKGIVYSWGALLQQCFVFIYRMQNFVLCAERLRTEQFMEPPYRRVSDSNTAGLTSE